MFQIDAKLFVVTISLQFDEVVDWWYNVGSLWIAKILTAFSGTADSRPLVRQRWP